MAASALKYGASQGVTLALQAIKGLCVVPSLVDDAESGVRNSRQLNCS